MGWRGGNSSSACSGGVTQLTELLLHYAAGPGCQTLRCNLPRYGPRFRDGRWCGLGRATGIWHGGKKMFVLYVYILNGGGIPIQFSGSYGFLKLISQNEMPFFVIVYPFPNGYRPGMDLVYTVYLFCTRIPFLISGKKKTSKKCPSWLPLIRVMTAPHQLIHREVSMPKSTKMSSSYKMYYTPEN